MMERHIIHCACGFIAAPPSAQPDDPNPARLHAERTNDRQADQSNAGAAGHNYFGK